MKRTYQPNNRKKAKRLGLKIPLPKQWFFTLKE